MEDQRHLVISPDGTILAASSDLPPGLIDKRLEDCTDLPIAIRTAGTDLLQRLRASGDRIVSQIVDSGIDEAPVRLMAIEALALRRTPTDLRKFLPSKLTVITSQAETAGVTLSVETTDDVPAVVPLDAEKVSWAVTTLVGNALRYVMTPSRRLGGKSIRVLTTFDRASSEVTITVRDDGPGIPADTVARMFVRHGVNARGAGLSLLLIRDILVAHGGRVDLRSNTNPTDHGTAIALTFPTAGRVPSR